ncbi:MAG: cobalt-precorrin 5A hydrolase [Desulfosalsimonas sp.]
MTKHLPTAAGRAMNKRREKRRTAIWAVTPGGAEIAFRLAKHIDGAAVYTGKNACGPGNARSFDSLARQVAGCFHEHDAHVFVMSAGIAVRMIAPHLGSKFSDPAVAAVDETGKFAVSLVSGHLGGANALAQKIASVIGAVPVITTATDRAGVPAIDLLAEEYGLETENPSAVKAVSMALISGTRIPCYDPFRILAGKLEGLADLIDKPVFENTPGIYIYQDRIALPETVLVLRPASLAVGVGCNSGTSADELCRAVNTVFEKYGLCTKSIRAFATITQKTGEPGIREIARHFRKPVLGYRADELAEITNVPTPSEMTEKHMGVKSVCEAAAIKAADSGAVIVPKHKTKNTTIAVAALPFL